MTLRRLAIGLTLGLAPLWCAASWVKLGQTPNLTLYLDRSSMQQVSETIHRAWELQDLAKPDPDGVRSRRFLNEYDCRYKMHRIGRMVSYSGPMLTGEKLFEVEDFGYWRDIPPKGLFALGYVAHCGK